ASTMKTTRQPDPETPRTVTCQQSRLKKDKTWRSSKNESSSHRNQPAISFPQGHWEEASPSIGYKDPIFLRRKLDIRNISNQGRLSGYLRDHGSAADVT